jgi:preprotein translocase subunit YajC
MKWFKKSSPTFQKGDKVIAFGNPGTIKNISSNGMFLEVTFDDAPNTVVFTIDGKVHSWNKLPTLKKI